MSSPLDDGFRFPPEWASHEATWVAWPHNRATWPGNFDPIPIVFERWIRAMARHESVCVLVPQHERATAATAVGHVRNVQLYEIPTNDSWIRDYGPMFCIHSERPETAIIDWGFNSWGEKYPPYNLDNDVPRAIAEQLKYPRYTGPIVLEGGALDHNGNGVFLVSAPSVIDERRNPGLCVNVIEEHIRRCCGAEDIFWIEGEMAGDDTDGHVDQLARFVSKDTIVYAEESHADDVNFSALEALRPQLAKIRLQNGTAPNLVPVPMPAPVIFDGARLPASYLNFCFINRGLIVPQFDQPTDDYVLELLEQLLPDRQMIPLPASEIVLGLGGFHCLSQQQPAAAAPEI